MIPRGTYADRNLRRRDRRLRRLWRHAGCASRAPRRARRDRRGGTARQHPHRLQHARDAVRFPQPSYPDDAAREGGVRFGAQPRRRRQNDVVERRVAALQSARFQGADLRRRGPGLADRLQGDRAVLRRDRARGWRLRQSRRPRRPARRHLPAAGADEVQRRHHPACRRIGRREAGARPQGDADGCGGHAAGMPLLRQLHGRLRRGGEVQLRRRPHRAGGENRHRHRLLRLHRPRGARLGRKPRDRRPLSASRASARGGGARAVRDSRLRLRAEHRAADDVDVAALSDRAGEFQRTPRPRLHPALHRRHRLHPRRSARHARHQ